MRKIRFTLVHAALLLLLQAAGLASTEVDISPEEFTKDVNEYRRQYAKAHNVSNMHALLWSDELANLPINWTEHFYMGKEGFRALIVYTANALNVVRNSLAKIVNQNFQWKGPGSEGYLETDNALRFFVPLQTFIGCTAEETRVDDNLGYVFLIGPHLENVPDEISENGSPGSKCKARFRNEDGLCVAENPKTMSLFKGDPHEFLKDVNLGRKNLAKQYNVPNMHQLVWNDSLVEIAKGLVWGEAWPQSQITWRYVATVYPGIMERLTRELTLRELLHPQQSQIGCIYMEAIDDVFNLCLLGNSGELEIFNFDSTSTDAPGSNCSTGFVNYDGLCSIPTTTTAAPKTQPARRPVTARPVATPEKQTSEEEDSGSRSLSSIYSALFCTLFVHFVLCSLME